MIISIYLKNSNKLLAQVDLEVVPRGIYKINGVEYVLKDQPKFFIDNDPFDWFDMSFKLNKVELYVEKVEDTIKDDSL